MKLEAKEINQIFRDHGLPEIPIGAQNFYPLLLSNLKALTKPKD